MILIKRGVEPPELTAQREKRLPAAQQEWEAHGASGPLKAMLVGYDGVKRLLWDRQHQKCAYCERKPGFGGQPVEHFRPKKEAWRHRRGEQRVVDGERYWWLTWSWANLLFACHTCNSAAQKGNYFPLVAGTNGLAIGEFDTTRESPLLLDPADASLDARAHLRWRPVERTAPRQVWRWTLETPTERGEVTAEILGLGYLADELNDHYRRTVWPRFWHEVEDLWRSRVETRRVIGAWMRLCRSLVAPSAPWMAASWFMLDALRGSTPDLLELRLPEPLWG